MSTAKTFSFIVKGKPHTCQRFWPQAYGVARDTKENRSAKKYIAKCVNERVEELGGFEPFEGAVKVGIKFFFKKGKHSKLDHPTHKRDIDNLVKTLMDGISRANGLPSSKKKKTVIWRDDDCVVELEASKHWCNDNVEPHTEVWIEGVK